MFAEGWAGAAPDGAVRCARPRGAIAAPIAGWRSSRRAAAIELPILEWSIAPTLTYQYATLSHGHPIVNGYSGYGSSLQEFLGGAASPLNDLDRMADALDLLRAVGVRYVLVHPGDYADPSQGAETVRGDPRATDARVGSRSARMQSSRFRLSDDAARRTQTFRRAAPAPGLRPGDFHADASDAADRLPLAFDGDGDTRWLTGRAQNGDEWIRIAFDRTRDVSAIALQTAARSFGDYPRELQIESAADDGARSVLYQGPMLVPYGRALAQGGPQPTLIIRLPANHTRTLTIRQTGRTRRWFWSVHELAIFER